MTTAINPAELSGLVSDDEGTELARLAALVERPHVIVEIGSYTGKSTCFMADAADADIFAIDLWDMKLPSEKKKGRRNKHKYAVKFNSIEARRIFTERTAAYGNVIPIRGESSEVSKGWTRPIGLLFIDGAHDTKSVTADYRGFSPHVVPGGYLAMHDATPGSKVDKVIEDVVIPSGLWGERRQVDWLAVFQRLEA
jgi:predicted O-methyltransferase YrrM